MPRAAQMAHWGPPAWRSRLGFQGQPVEDNFTADCFAVHFSLRPLWLPPERKMPPDTLGSRTLCTSGLSLDCLATSGFILLSTGYPIRSKRLKAAGSLGRVPSSRLPGFLLQLESMKEECSADSVSPTRLVTEQKTPWLVVPRQCPFLDIILITWKDNMPFSHFRFVF